jgi:hypothetical protein
LSLSLDEFSSVSSGDELKSCRPDEEIHFFLTFFVAGSCSGIVGITFTFDLEDD